MRKAMKSRAVLLLQYMLDPSLVSKHILTIPCRFQSSLQSILKLAGNRKYRALIDLHRIPYSKSHKKNSKTDISRMIVRIIQQNGGRFLRKQKKSDPFYSDIGETKAIEKVSQALREGQPELKKKLNTLTATKPQHRIVSPPLSPVSRKDGDNVVRDTPTIPLLLPSFEHQSPLLEPLPRHRLISDDGVSTCVTPRPDPIARNRTDNTLVQFADGWNSDDDSEIDEFDSSFDGDVSDQILKDKSTNDMNSRMNSRMSPLSEHLCSFYQLNQWEPIKLKDIPKFDNFQTNDFQTLFSWSGLLDHSDNRRSNNVIFNGSC